LLQIRRNTEEFAKVATLLHDYKDRPDRKKLVLLYALKPSQDLGEKILINKLKQNAATLYNMSYDSILQYLDDRTQKLYREGEKPLYYFKSSASSEWLKFPFEFAGKLRNKTLPLRVVR
jgi:hypothetical protein